MKVLWLVNIELPAISEIRGKNISPFGGWLAGLLNQISKDPELQLVIAYPDPNCKSDYDKGKVYGNVEYVAFHEYRTTKKNYKNQKIVLHKILEDVKPDIIHIHGTEYMHSCALSEIAYGNTPVAISIQGLLAPIYKYYCCGIPEREKYKITIRSLLKRDFMIYDLLSLKKRSKYERRALQYTDYVIGRTDWDKAHTTWTAPQAKYEKNNESLRELFYSAQWDYESCEKNTLFISQSDSPIKGFHFLLNALVLVKREIPDITVYAIGAEKNPRALSTPKHLNSYQQYIYKLIRDNKLEDNITFIGRLSEPEMVSQMQKANLFVCPSSCENSPNSLGEAMILGVPCIASDVGGISSLMNNGVEGILYRCDEVSLMSYYIISLLKDHEKAISYGKAARKRAMMTHNRSENYKQLLAIYNEMLYPERV